MTAAFTLPPPRRKARVRQVPGTPLPLPSALPHAPCSYYQAVYCQGSITVRDHSQAEALWYNGCFGHGAAVGGRGRPKGRKKWRLVEADGLKTPKWFKEARTQQREAERGAGNEMEVDCNEDKEEVDEREKREGLEVMEEGNFDKEEKNEEVERLNAKEDIEERKGLVVMEEENGDKEEKNIEVERLHTKEEEEEKEKQVQEAQNMEAKSVDTETERQAEQEDKESKTKEPQTEDTERDKEHTTNQENKEDKENIKSTEEQEREVEDSDEDPTLSDPEITEPWRTVVILSPDQKGHSDTQNSDSYLKLLPEEAMFLSYALGCLVLTHEGTDESYKGRKRAIDERISHEMTIDEMWRVFSQQDASFPMKYAVYHHYRTQGWVVKAGLKYGVDYVLYPVGPAFYHSQYAVRVYSVWGDSLTLDTTVPGHAATWTTTATTERLANHVNKTPIICFVVRPRALTQQRLGLIDCLKELKVQEMVLSRWSPTNGAL